MIDQAECDECKHRDTVWHKDVLRLPGHEAAVFEAALIEHIIEQEARYEDKECGVSGNYAAERLEYD